MKSEVERAAAARRAPNFDAPLSCFTVQAAGHLFGLPVDAVQTIFRLQAITPVPLGPEVILGLVNLRGKIVTAVSLEKRLGLLEKSLDPLEKSFGPKNRGATQVSPFAVAIDCRGESFALVVDAVGDALTCYERDKIAPPRHVAEERARLTEAYYRIENAILPVLNMDALFDIRPARRSKAEHFAMPEAPLSGADL